jgi:hypothetical protein
MKFRFIYLLFIVLVIPLGLFIRVNKANFPSLIGEFAPDTLWALMLFWIFGLLFFRKSAHQIFLITLAFTFVIEFSQFFKWEWLMQARQTFLGAMLLGHSFLWSDLVCYTVGIWAGWLLEKQLSKSSLLKPK